MTLPDSVQQIVPGIGGWVGGLSTDPLAMRLQDVFAEIEVAHILGLLLLASATILVSLRLIGVGLVEAPASLIWRNTRGFLALGVALGVGSGLLMGLSEASKLYNNTAFLFKMVGLVAAVVFSFGVMRPMAKADGQVGAGAKAALIVAAVVWGAALVEMVAKTGANVAAFHLICAGALIAGFAMRGRARWAMLIGAVVIVAAWQVVTHLFVTQGTSEADLARYMGANKQFVVALAVWVLGWSAANIAGVSAAKGTSAMARLVGYATILAWVTVAAGGRWIGLT